MPVDVSDDTGAQDGERIRRQVAFLLEQLNLDPECEVSIAFVDVDTMTELHVRWMDEPGPTDVLSFPMDDLRPGAPGDVPPVGVVGDIVICPEIAAAQADAAGHPVETEIALLVTHGMLHLLGFDHAEPDEHAVMFGLQDELLAAWLAESTGR
jgi:probable rRNA maturation factor